MKRQVKKLIYLLDFRVLGIYLVIGGTTAVINFSIFTFLWNFEHINYQVSISISYILSVIFHFTANRRFTFKSHDRNLYKHLAKYLAMVLINYLITLLVMHIAVEIFKLSPYIGVIASIGTTVGVGYFLARFWVFI
ncbi:MAG: hypothetical protein A2X12_02185 [Bacteroidetes bacterium GWE2_29_8]|nr:MAG: hypothetical protein A2X12_02185 [Bacteroidetes bacterium GWE2_29_8]